MIIRAIVFSGMLGFYTGCTCMHVTRVSSPLMGRDKNQSPGTSDEATVQNCFLFPQSDALRNDARERGSRATSQLD